MEFIALLLPVLIDFINRKVADSDLRLAVSVFVCVIFGTLVNYLETNFAFVSPMIAFESITTSIMMVFGLAQLSFKTIWEKTDAHRKLKDEAMK